MAEDHGFPGFSRETIAFLRGLKKNNTRDWFESHRKNYNDFVLEPAKAFVVAMGLRLKEILPNIVAAPKINKSIFRLNRDTRFSPDKSPYKTNLGIYFWEGPRSRMESPGFYVHLEPPIFLLGAGYWMFPDWLLESYRKAVVHPKSGGELAKILKKIAETTDFRIGGMHYKRTPAGYDGSHPNAPLLLHNALHAGLEQTIPDVLLTPGLADYCYEKFKPLAPLHRWLSDLISRSAPPPDHFRS
ncbi:MAG: hypothetical protein A2Y69_06225 [Candidatus Aminicenantes bacterium RBG_13_59_9]|nr:MAG: hypothetical protein A2Y69_06225 [Candidatus Aminicenantes bacterium RBG_13_59_9]